MPDFFQKTLDLYRKAYSGHPKEIWTLAGLTLANRMGMMVLPFLSVYLTTQHGFTLKQAGILAGAYGFGSLLGSWLGGKFTDLFGGRPVILLTLLVSGCFLIALQWADSFNGFLILIFLAASTGEGYRPAVGALVGDYVPKAQTGRAMSLIRLAIGLGMSAGPAIGGWIAISAGYKWLFWIDGVTCVVAAIFFAFAARGWSRHPESEQEVGLEEETSSDLDGSVPSDLAAPSDLAPSDLATARSVPPYRNPDFIWFMLVSILAGMVLAQWFHTVPVFIKSEWGFDEDLIGILLGMTSLIIVLVEMPIVYTMEKASKVHLSTMLGMAFFGLSLAPFLLPKAIGLTFLAAGIWTLGLMFYLSFNNSIPLKMSPPDRRGDYMAWYWMAWSVVRIIAPILGFFLADELGYPTFWCAMGGVALVAILLSLKMGKRLVGSES